MEKQSLVMDVRVGDSVSIDSGRIVLTVREKSGQRSKLHFSVDKGIVIAPVRFERGADMAKHGIAVA